MKLKERDGSVRGIGEEIVDILVMYEITKNNKLIFFKKNFLTNKYKIFFKLTLIIYLFCYLNIFNYDCRKRSCGMNKKRNS